MGTEGMEIYQPFYCRTSAGIQDAKRLPENDLQAYKELVSPRHSTKLKPKAEETLGLSSRIRLQEPTPPTGQFQPQRQTPKSAPECVQTESTLARRDLNVEHGIHRRLYRNLSEKLKGSHSSFDEAYFKTRTDRLSLRKTSVNFQGNEAMFEAVEQQDLDAVQLLLYQYTPEELDLNTPNSEGLTPLDIAIMTNNVPIARILLRTGARESPHFVSRESRAMHLNTLVQEAQDRVSELSAQVENEGFTLDNTEKEKQLKAWEWRYRLYRRMKTGFEHASEYAQRTEARAPEVPTNACLMVTSSTSLTVSFQEPLSVNAAVVTRYKGTALPIFSLWSFLESQNIAVHINVKVQEGTTVKKLFSDAQPSSAASSYLLSVPQDPCFQ
ncbi:hypothetical protein A6R68_22354 [Neotoma lepida]|uniref:Uncharacterized protein n=1 Tax=Neotoma lepida TaxID=56216 RepID=A0A1A6HZJ4_NEOLE|nr:hypothetical protein A6R68_22354 [Neotoma lepida]